MAKKKVTITETDEETAPPEEKKKVDPPVEKKDEEEPVEQKKVEKKDEKAKDAAEGAKDEQKGKKEDGKPAAQAPAPTPDDDMAFLKAVFQKQMIDSLDVDTLKKFVVECEGKSLKQKAEWIEKNKPAQQPDASKGLAKGPPGGKPLGPYDPGYKHVFIDNRPKH